MPDLGSGEIRLNLTADFVYNFLSHPSDSQTDKSKSVTSLAETTRASKLYTTKGHIMPIFGTEWMNP